MIVAIRRHSLHIEDRLASVGSAVSRRLWSNPSYSVRDEFFHDPRFVICVDDLSTYKQYTLNSTGPDGDAETHFKADGEDRVWCIFLCVSYSSWDLAHPTAVRKCANFRWRRQSSVENTTEPRWQTRGASCSAARCANLCVTTVTTATRRCWWWSPPNGDDECGENFFSSEFPFQVGDEKGKNLV